MATAQQGTTQTAATGNGNGNGTPAKAARKPRDPNAPKKVSPKVKANNEVRTYLMQQRQAALEGKSGTARHIEAERFDRMLDAVEGLFPAGHKFNIPRETESGQVVSVAPGTAAQ
ncbi:MAG TPA: hypothetical protein VF681_14700 [Abditibacteriaceae bacterium]